MPKAKASQADEIPFGAKNRTNKKGAYIRESKSKGCVYEGVIPPDATHFKAKTLYGQTIEEVRGKVREFLAKREGTMDDVVETPHDMQDYRRMLVMRHEAGLPNTTRLIHIFDPGMEVTKNIMKYKLTNDVVQDGIKVGRQLKIGIGRFVAAAYSKIPEGYSRTPGRELNTYKKNMRPSLVRLIKAVGWKTPVIEVITGSKSKWFKKWIFENIIKLTAEREFSTRCQDRQYYRRIFKLGCEIYDFPKTDSWFLNDKPQGTRNPIVVPSPEVIRKFKTLLLNEAPEIFLFGILQMDFFLRTEEAARALEDPRSFIADLKFNFPEHLSKLGTVGDRDIQIRPSTMAWLEKIPGWTDGRRDYRLFEDGTEVNPQELQKRLYKILRAAGFNPERGMDDECLRKGGLSAGIACCAGPWEHHLIAQEASHARLDTLYKHYNARWTRAMGIAYWSIFLPKFRTASQSSTFTGPTARCLPLAKHSHFMNNTTHNPIAPVERPDINKNHKDIMRKPKQHTNARTAQFLRDRDFTVVPLQVWNAAARIRQDAVGLWDTLAYSPIHGVLVAQNTTKTHLADHRRAIEVAPEAIKWLQSGAQAFLISWRKVGAKGSVLRWQPRIEQVVLARGKLFLVRITELPIMGQPAPAVPTAAREKRSLPRRERLQEAMQARVQAHLKASGFPQGEGGQTGDQKLLKLGQGAPSVVLSPAEKRRRTMAKREQAAMKAHVAEVMAKMVTEQGNQEAV